MKTKSALKTTCSVALLSLSFAAVDLGVAQDAVPAKPQADAAATAQKDEPLVGVLIVQPHNNSTIYLIQPDQGRKVPILVRFADLKNDVFGLKALEGKRVKVVFTTQGEGETKRKFVSGVTPIL